MFVGESRCVRNAFVSMVEKQHKSNTVSVSSAIGNNFERERTQRRSSTHLLGVGCPVYGGVRQTLWWHDDLIPHVLGEP
eukprot:3966558-Amphidinium_carterae.2